MLPTWFLVPFAIVAVLGLIGGSVLDIYSSGLALLTLGVRIPRYAAALIDGTVMTLGTIYVVFVAHTFIGQFEGFLITLGVPIAAWCGITLADIALRRGKTGAWAFANLGVLVALAFGFVAHLVFGWAKVRAEEAGPLPAPATA